MECAERGVRCDGDGRISRFGDVEAHRSGAATRSPPESGAGDLLAEGSRGAAARVGPGSEAWAMHVKGLEMPGYEPRGLKTMALGFAVSPRGACHNRSRRLRGRLLGRGRPLRRGGRPGPLAAEAEDLAADPRLADPVQVRPQCFDDLYPDAAAELYRW